MRIRFKDGTPATAHDVEAIARAFGFSSAAEMDRVCEEADRRRAARANFGKLAS